MDETTEWESGEPKDRAWGQICRLGEGEKNQAEQKGHGNFWEMG